MGQIFSQLTQPNSALVNPNGTVAAMGDPSQIRDADFKINSQQHPYLPGTPNPNPPAPTAQTPSFAQAASYGATPGGANAMSPGLTKAGKLATLLTSGLQGALAGRAKSEETVAATGGRRSGGAGMGFEAGYTLPWQRAGQQLGLQQQEANVEATRAQNAIVNTPQGPMPAWLARYTAPAYIRAGATEQAATTRAGAQTQAAQIGAQGKVAAAEVGQRFKAVPGVGLYDTSSRQVIPGTAQAVTITPEIASDYQLPSEFVGKPMNVGQLASLERAQNQQITTVTGAEGPALVNKRTAKTTPLGLGSSAMGGVVPVAADPNNPGNITYAPKREAVGMTSPQSAPSQAARSITKSAVSGKIGDEINAFNTALQHADLLQNALGAMNNGDTKTLNSLKNRFKTEFGSSDVTNFQTISSAYQREITKMLSAGHITDGEIADAGAKLPSNASPQQILGAIQAYKQLATSKMNMRRQQVQQGQKGQANFPTESGPTAEDMLKKYPPKKQ